MGNRDTNIIEVLKADRREGIELLRENYGNMIRYVAASILRGHSDEEIEKCLTDTCVKAWRRIGSFDYTKGSFASWISVIARNAAVAAAGIKAQDIEPADATDMAADDAPEGAIMRKEELIAIRAAVMMLSPRDRELILRRYFYLQDIRQIAAEMGLSERAADGRLRHLRRSSLKKLIGGGELE